MDYKWDGSIIIFDFEVFKYDVLLGCILLKNNEQKLIQIWDIKEIKKFFYSHTNSMWIGHNNQYYDNIIMDAIITDKNIYNISNKIINERYKPYNIIKFINYDLMNGSFFSLKSTEAVYGKNISETEVSFDLDRKLTEEERLLTESYNKDDLEQTLINFFEKTNFGKFKARINVINEFGLDYTYLNVTEAKLAAKCLGAKHIDGIEYQYIDPPLYPFLKLNNKELLQFYLDGKFKRGEHINVNICNVDHKLGDGGGHGALNKCYFDKAIYCDVSGYYNLLMINLDLLPRTMPKESKEKYIHLYHEQLKLKKTDPERRQALKVVLLAVWGAMRNEYTDFYDPEKGSLMTITGQLFIMDLLEKLEPYIILVQTNTDGIIIVPKRWDDEQKVLDIVKEWTERTKFTIKPEYIYNIYQRDVNNYMYKDSEGKIHCKGEALKHWNSDENIFGNKMFDSKEPIIIAKGIVNYFMNKITPEKTVLDNKLNLTWFEWIVKKNSYDYLQYEEIGIDNIIKTERLQNVNRVFASNNDKSMGMVYKYKYSKGKLNKAKVSNLPDNVFVYNGDINNDEIKKILDNSIDFDYYINRIKERICEFIKLPQIKEMII